jgi:hypothetical protein
MSVRRSHEVTEYLAPTGCWRTLQDLTDLAIVQSYLDTATK